MPQCRPGHADQLEQVADAARDIRERWPDPDDDAHSAAIARAPSRRFAGRRRRFGPDDAEAVLRELRAGRTIGEAAGHAKAPPARRRGACVVWAGRDSCDLRASPGMPAEHGRCAPALSVLLSYQSCGARSEGSATGGTQRFTGSV